MKGDVLNFNSLTNPTERYKLDKLIGWGIFGQVYRAHDQNASGRAVAVKMRMLNQVTEEAVQEEYQILRDMTAHPNITDFYGVFCERCPVNDKIWFILELCEGGSAIDLVRKLQTNDKKMREEHIAFILKETIKALTYLHERKVMHRNVRSSNILLTKEGEVKISDFGISAKLAGSLGKRTTKIGSPSWIAPEVVTSCQTGYDNRADVWALGITTIELADGKAPFQDMHPTRVLFQIVRNPPPILQKPSMWSNDINDFISECLEKNPENRPFIMELQEHPFIQHIPENSHHLTQELRKLIKDMSCIEVPIASRIPERIVKNGSLISEANPEPESMQVEDLAAMDVLSEAAINEELRVKLKKDAFTSFIGDVLLIVNPHTEYDIYNEEYHKKYECKSRSDNKPHIFAVADSAYQDALHHNEPQHIVFSGESGSGKSINAGHAVRHLAYLGRMNNNTSERIDKAASVIRVATHATTPCNANSTRCVMQTQVTYGTSGKLSGAIFWVYLLEKWRISSTDMSQANYNLLYYFYDAKEAGNKLRLFHLNKERKHRYLRISDDKSRVTHCPRDNVKGNIKKYEEFICNLKDLEFEESDLVVLEKIIAAILILGNVCFKESVNGYAVIENLETAVFVSKLLDLDEKKFIWALSNYCLVDKGSVVKKKHTPDEARDARDILAGTLYKRLIDWLVNTINFKLSFGRAVFGDKYCVNVMDMFGFECFRRNRLDQLIVNTINEQMQFLYNQRMFAWEMLEEAEEQVPVVSLQFYDNKTALDQLLGRPVGLFYILDDASKRSGGLEFIRSAIKRTSKGPFLSLQGPHEFSVAHYTGKINYDARDMADKNLDFLPPEMIETLRDSSSSVVTYMFTSRLTKSGNLMVPSSQPKIAGNRLKSEKEEFNAGSVGEYSQIHHMRTASATLRATSLEILKQLSIGSNSGGTYFVRCIRPDLTDKPKGFHPEVVRQQVRALAILDTAKARQNGYSSRIPFAEFIIRYKFLAFGFDENVEESKDNCRLLLIRLKMEGWMLGNTKVFLKYYNVEFLSRLYEVQVKKIVKVQCMMRRFLTRRKILKDKAKKLHMQNLHKQNSLSLDETDAAVMIQSAYRGYTVRKECGPLKNSSNKNILDEKTLRFIRRYAIKWRRKSIFHVLLQYRAVCYQDFFNFSQQVHIYNQALMEALVNSQRNVLLESIDPYRRAKEFLGHPSLTVWKLPFRINELQYFDTSHMCEPSMQISEHDSDQGTWDEPLQRRASCKTLTHPKPLAQSIEFSDNTYQNDQIKNQSLIYVPFSRDPSQPINVLPLDTSISPRLLARVPATAHVAHPPTPLSHSRKPFHEANPMQSSTKPIIHTNKPFQRSDSPLKTCNYKPPTPWSSQKDISENVDRNFTLRKTDRSRSLYGVNTPDNMNNSIKEMQELANSNSTINASTEDSPFNFQAMLKRTPRNRASMKRAGESEFAIFEQEAQIEKVHHQKGKAPSRPHSCQELQTIQYTDATEIQTRVTVELAPGVSVEGVIVDL